MLMNNIFELQFKKCEEIGWLTAISGNNLMMLISYTKQCHKELVEYGAELASWRIVKVA